MDLPRQSFHRPFGVACTVRTNPTRAIPPLRPVSEDGSVARLHRLSSELSPRLHSTTTERSVTESNSVQSFSLEIVTPPAWATSAGHRRCIAGYARVAERGAAHGDEPLRLPCRRPTRRAGAPQCPARGTVTIRSQRVGDAPSPACGGRLDMKFRRLVVVVSLLAGGLLTVSNPVTADVVDGNPMFTDHHQVTLSKYVNLIYSKQDPCSGWYEPQRGAPVRAWGWTAWDGFPGDLLRAALATLASARLPVGGRKMGLVISCEGVTGATTTTSTGSTPTATAVAFQATTFACKCPQVQPSRRHRALRGPYVEMTEGGKRRLGRYRLQHAAGGRLSTNPVSDRRGLDMRRSGLRRAEDQPIHAGYRHVHFKSPIPSMTCSGGARSSSRPGHVTVTGVQFPAG